MSSGRWRFIPLAILLLFPALDDAVQAQDEPAMTAQMLADSQRADITDSLHRPQECQADEFQPDTIVVCGEMGRQAQETQRAMSVLPRPIDPQINQLEGLREPPCWVTGKKPCLRGGWAPPPVVLIDLDAIPEALPGDVAAQVFNADETAGPQEQP